MDFLREGTEILLQKGKDISGFWKGLTNMRGRTLWKEAIACLEEEA